MAHNCGLPLWLCLYHPYDQLCRRCVVEITVNKIDTLGEFDDACRQVNCEISVANNVSKRRQRQAVIYETLAALMGYMVPHQLLEDITHKLGEALDQLD